MLLPAIGPNETVISENDMARLSIYRGYKVRYELAFYSKTHDKWRCVPFRELTDDIFGQAIKTAIADGADPSDFEGLTLP